MACLHPMGITRPNTLRCIYPFQGLARGRTLAIRPYSRPEKKSCRNLRSCAKYPVAQLQQQRAATSAYSARRTPISTAQMFGAKVRQFSDITYKTDKKIIKLTYFSSIASSFNRRYILCTMIYSLLVVSYSAKIFVSFSSMTYTMSFWTLLPVLSRISNRCATL